MASIKKYGLLAGKFLACLFIGAFLLSLFNYFCFSTKLTNKIGFGFLILLFLIFSFKEAKKSTARGIITGLKTGLLFLLLLLLINLFFFRSPFKWARIIYYLILFFASILGGITGINTKKNESL